MEISPIQQQITFLYAKDLIVTRYFYESILGFKIARDQGDCIIYGLTPTSFLGFCSRHKPEGLNPIIITLITSDVWGWYDILKQRGVNFEAPPCTNAFYGITHFFLRDPDGYRIEIQCFDQPLEEPSI